MSIGERIRHVRTQQALTAEQLSTASGVPAKTIYRIETGDVSDPKLSTVVALIKALNCSADELIFDRDSYSKLGALRRLFVQFNELRDVQQELLLEVNQKILLAMAIEASVLTPVSQET